MNSDNVAPGEGEEMMVTVPRGDIDGSKEVQALRPTSHWPPRDLGFTNADVLGDPTT